VQPNENSLPLNIWMQHTVACGKNQEGEGGVEQGGQEALTIDRMVNEYADRLLRAAFLILGDFHLAEDAVQEALIDAATHLASFRGESTLYTWLYRILVRRCRRQQQRKFWNMLEVVPADTLERLSSKRNVPGDQIALEKLELTAAVHKLPAKYREIVALYYYEDLTIAEIAGILAASEGTVKNRLHRARQKLAKLLREGESDEFQAKTTS
jgi:RNA polymerase sigma-70 factor (ECF subfamily)